MKIFLFYATAGHGHKKASEAVYEEMKKRGLDKTNDVRLIDALEYTRFGFGKNYTDSYFFLVARASWLWAALYALSDRIVPWALMRVLRGWNNAFFAGPLEVLLKRENPDLILTTHFLSAEVAGRLKSRGKISSKIVVIVTDFLVHRYWVNPGTDFYVGMMEETRKAFLDWGIAPEKIQILGIPISGKFRMPVDKNALLRGLALETDRFTLLVTSGSFGIGPLKELIGRLDIFKEKVQVIAVCGTNQELHDELKRNPYDFPMAVLGFVNNMHELMVASDVLVSRSSGLTTSESLARGVPLIVVSKIPGQESCNADILEKHNAAFFAWTVDDLIRLIGGILEDPGRLEAVRANVKALAKPDSARDITDLALRILAR